MKIRLVGAEQFHAHRRTDGLDEVNSRFSQFCDTRLKNKNISLHQHVQTHLKPTQTPIHRVGTDFLGNKAVAT
jgi:DNA-binding transcriptional regulator WhiA